MGFLPVFSLEWQEDFSDAIRAYQTWVGDWDQFAINKKGQLQSQSSEGGEMALFRSSGCTIAAEWLWWVRISGTCSAYNLVRLFPVITSADASADGFFVQVGGANKNIRFCAQEGGELSTLIEHPDRKKILDAAATYLSIRLVRDEDGWFELSTLRDGIDSVWIVEGSCFVDYVSGGYSGVLVKSSKTRGYDFFFDDFSAHGETQLQPIEEVSDEGSVCVTDYAVHFSPNNDGWEDVACISFEIPREGYLLDAQVYTASGVLVRRLCDEVILSDSGNICWDGTNEQSETVGNGIYVVYLHFRHPDTGDVLRKKIGVSVVY